MAEKQLAGASDYGGGAGSDLVSEQPVGIWTERQRDGDSGSADGNTGNDNANLADYTYRPWERYADATTHSDYTHHINREHTPDGYWYWDNADKRWHFHDYAND